MDDNLKSDILSYNPDLRIVGKKSNLTFESEKEDVYIPEYESITGSVTLKQFKEYKPSSNLFKIDDFKNDIKTSLEDMKGTLMQDSNVANYFNSNSLTVKEDNFKNPCGNTLFEAYCTLEDIEKEITSVEKLYKEVNYGVEDVSLNEANKIDDTYINKIETLENENNTNTVNYFSLYCDNSVNYIISEYIDGLRKDVSDILKIKNTKSNTFVKDTNKEVVVSLFEKLNKTLDYDLYKNVENTKEICIAIKNVFSVKSEKNSYINAFSDMYLTGSDYSVINDIKIENEKELTDSIEALVKISMLSVICKSDICEMLNKKSKIRSFLVNN